MPDRNFENRTLYHGDNLDFLRGMNSETVNLIATDPPFNKSRDFHATPDKLSAGARFVDRWHWDKDVHQDWVDAIKDDWPGVWQSIENGRVNHSPGMAAFLCWLGIRLIEMRRVLAWDGTIYLHIDHTAHAYAKALMDAIFDRRNFRNEIVWCYRGAGYPKTDFGRRHDTLLRYSKGNQYTFNLDDVREEYAEATVERFSHYIGNRRRSGDFGLQSLHPLGKPPDDWWEIQPIAPSAKERYGYPTQKPLALYEKIIKASSNEGDMVLDPFCGCATTPIASERLGRQWIGMDIWEGAYKAVQERASNSRQLLVDIPPEITLKTTPPQRTDESDDTQAVPDLRLRLQRVKERWERLSHAEIVEILTTAQTNGDGNKVICAGCGIQLPGRYMQLDHQLPRKDGGENVITNRILLCGPCNNTKRAELTLSGLIRDNKRAGYMADETMAELAATKARDAAQRCRTEMR